MLAVAVLLPVLDAEPRHALKLAGVVGDERQAAGQRLAGDQHVVGADRRAGCRQSRAQLARLARVLAVEVQHLELQGIHPREIFGRALPLVGPVEEFVGDDGGNTEVSRLVFAQSRQESRMAFHQGYDGVAVEQELHLK